MNSSPWTYCSFKLASVVIAILCVICIILQFYGKWSICLSIRILCFINPTVNKKWGNTASTTVFGGYCGLYLSEKNKPHPFSSNYFCLLRLFYPNKIHSASFSRRFLHHNGLFSPPRRIDRSTILSIHAGYLVMILRIGGKETPPIPPICISN